MSSVTAQILVGTRSHFNDGIRPTHAIYLSENDRPVLLLRAIDLYGEEREEEPLGSEEGFWGFSRATPWVWIPTTERTLEDAILMLSVYVLESEEVIKHLGFNPCSAARGAVGGPVELYSVFSEEQREELYGICRSLPNDLSLLVTLLDSSVMSQRIHCLAEYSMEVTVCQETFSRLDGARPAGLQQSGALLSQDIALTTDQLNLIEVIRKVPPEIWFEIGSWAAETKSLQGWQRELANSLGGVAANPTEEPSVRMAIQGRKIIMDAVDLGYTNDALTDARTKEIEEAFDV